MAVKVRIDGGNLVLEVEGWDRLFSFRSSLQFPLEHVEQVASDPEGADEKLVGVKLAGWSIPGVMRAGTWAGKDGLLFWDVHDPRKAIRIDLKDERYSHLFVEVEDPQAAVDTIQKALAPAT